MATLFLSPFFYPEPISTGRYNSFLASAILKKGEKVFVACSHPLYPDWVPKVSEDTLGDAKIFRGGGWLRYPRAAILRRLMLELWFAFHASSVSFRLRKDVDSVVAIFPPSLFFLFVHQILPARVQRVGIVHDLQGLLGLSGGGFLKNFFNRIVRFVERRGFSSCDRLILLSEGMKEHVVTKYGINPEKCSVRYPFQTQEVHFPEAGIRGILLSLFPVGYRHVVYSGALGDKQAPDKLLELFKGLVSQRQDVICHIFSRGPIFDRLQNLPELKLQERIRFQDLVEENDLPELLARSSVQIIPQKTGTADGAFPSKLPNLLAAGVPVFAITEKESELYSVLKNSGIGECSFTWENNEILPRLCAFLDRMGKQSHAERIAATREFVNKYFHVDSLIEELRAA